MSWRKRSAVRNIKKGSLAKSVPKITHRLSKSFSIFLIRATYFLFGLLVILGGNFNLPFLVYVFKPLLMPTLILFVLISAKPQAGRKFIIITALFFALLGDVALIFDHQFFVFGLASFLITHIFYCIVFSKPIKLNTIIFNGKTLLVAIIFILFYVLLMSVLWEHLHELLVPVLIYGFVLTLMGYMAFLRPINSGYAKVLFGASFFIVSDAILAINFFLFSSALPFAPAFVIFFYVLAQYLIVQGLLEKNR